MSIYQVILTHPHGQQSYLAKGENPSQAVTAVIYKHKMTKSDIHNIYVICQDDNILTTDKDFRFGIRKHDGFLSVDTGNLPVQVSDEKQCDVEELLEKFKDIWETKK